MEPVIEIHPGATKWDIRQRVWDHIEDNNLANFPRPVHNRIPNFKGAFTACAKISELQAFAQADVVKVDPDKPLEGARLAILQAQKTLLVPTPRLRTGLFNRITPPQGATKEQLRICSSSQGVRDFSVPVALDAEVKVDLVVVGSVAVSEKGLRIGKGEGFADMEYGMMASMGSVNESTVVVTVVHDCQVVDIPEELIQSHDLTVDYILTPTRVIKTDCQFPKPHGIIWNKLDKERLEKIPILKELRALEEEAGKDVTLGESAAGAEPEQPKRQTRRRPRHNAAKHDAAPEQPKPERIEAERKPRQRPARVRRESRGETERGGRGRRGENAKVSEDGGGDATSPLGSPRKFPASVTTVYLGGIPAGLRVSELKTALREREAAPLRLTWQGAQHRAFLDYSDAHGAEQALKALQDLSLNGHSLQAELAKSQRGGGAAGGGKRSGQSGGRPRPPAKSKTPPTQQQRDAESDGGDNGDGGGDNDGGGEKPEQ